MRKNLVISILILLLFANATAQVTIKSIDAELTDSPILNNVYYKDLNHVLSGCTGIWQYSNGSDYFKITFYLVENVRENPDSPYKRYADRLMAKYIYKKNGVTIYDSSGTVYPVYSNVNIKDNRLKSSYVQGNVISFVYTEPSFTECHRLKTGTLDIQANGSNPGATMTWTRITDQKYYNSGLCNNGALADDSDFLLPATMTLTKIN